MLRVNPRSTMNSRPLTILLLFWLLAGAIGHSDPSSLPEQEHVSWYRGTRTWFAKDGKIPIGKTDLLLKRTVFNGGSRVVEVWTSSAPSPSQSPTSSEVHLTRRAQTLLYDITDPRGLIKGTAHFKRADLLEWTFRIDHSRLGKTEGEGQIAENSICVIANLEATEARRVVDELRKVSREEYEQELAFMHPLEGSE